MVLISPGTYTNIVEHKLTEHFFGERVVTVEFLPGTDGVLVRVTLSAETTHPVEQQRGGWQAILARPHSPNVRWILIP